MYLKLLRYEQHYNNATEATNDDVANDVANNEVVSDIRTYSEAEDAEDNDEKIATQPPAHLKN